MNKFSPSFLMSMLLLGLLLFLGFRLASQKPLWNDEIYSQVASVENLSYSEILLGKVNEGNAAPLFYLCQKGITAAVGYTSPLEWRIKAKIWDFDRPIDRIVLRVGSVVAMSLAIVLIFYYFAEMNSFVTAGFSLFLTLSSPMFLNYWAEARPYAGWIMLTTFQILTVLSIIRKGNAQKRDMVKLSIAHMGLSFTVILSLPQIALAGFILWIYRVRNLGSYVFILFLPVLIILTYHGVSPVYSFGVVFTLDQYLRANISRDRFYIMWLFLLVTLLYGVQLKWRVQTMVTSEILKGMPVFVLLCGFVTCASALFLLFTIKQGPAVQFPVSEKYFIFLAPAGVIAVAGFVDAMFRAIQGRWLKSAFVVFVAGLIIPRSIKVIAEFLENFPHFSQL